MLYILKNFKRRIWT